jgi:adenine-specific DNA-methyltransferase
VSRLTDLLRQARKADPQLGADLEAEFDALVKRRTFGLVFEQHQPEAVELPGRVVKRGDKVRVLPPRGELEPGDQQLWRVERIELVDGHRVAHVKEADADEPRTQAVFADDLVVVAEFRDRIYPGLVETGRVERGGDKPFHTVINGENFHALEMLSYTHHHKVDAIYIDPPYNSGAKDWKYNNDYVGSDDDYRHSKWLAFMERRLKVARDLLNPDGSVLIVTIDEKEYARLHLLLEQVFPEAKMQMVSSVINPRGIVRENEFARSNEFIFFLWFGNAHISPEGIEESSGTPVAWETMRRRSVAGARGRKGKGACGPNQFFAIHVDEQSGTIVGRGDPLPLTAQISEYVAPDGCIAVFPARDDGTEMNWSLTDTAFDSRFAAGYVRAGKVTPGKTQTYIMQYVLGGVIQDIEDGKAVVTGRAEDGSVIAEYVDEKERMPHTQWNKPSHNAQQHGTGLLSDILPGRWFPYAKSLYAVEDALRFFVKDNPDAVILDFFSGSGTSAHAVMRLNKQDDGRRQCISVTNNEVSASEQQVLRQEGFRPGDEDWEMLGICDYVTKPRIEAAITGETPEGAVIKGDYRFTDEFRMSDGFQENAAFLTLTYEAPSRSSTIGRSSGSPRCYGCVPDPKVG